MGYALVPFLVVEDDDLDFRILQRTFRKLHIENPVIRATDGVEAMEMMKGMNGRKRLYPPYITLLDINMPRKNGLEVLREMRADPDLKDNVVFVLSSSDAGSDVEEAYGQKVAGYVLKGLPSDDFAEAIRLIHRYPDLPSPSNDC